MLYRGNTVRYDYLAEYLSHVRNALRSNGFLINARQLDKIILRQLVICSQVTGESQLLLDTNLYSFHETNLIVFPISDTLLDEQKPRELPRRGLLARLRLQPTYDVAAKDASSFTTSILSRKRPQTKTKTTNKTFLLLLTPYF